jgi:hypothetical protein
MVSTTMARILGVLRTAPDLSATTLAMLYGMPPSTLTNAMRERIQLSSEREAELHTLAQRAADILEALRPLSIPKGDWQTLDALVKSEFTPEEISKRVSQLFNSGDTEGVGTSSQCVSTNRNPDLTGM